MGNSTIDEVNEEEFEEVKVARRPKKRSNRKKDVKRNINKKSKKENKLQIIFTVLFSLGTAGIIFVLFLLYGPFSGFREWLVTTAMTTMTHQYFATWFYDDETIAYILDKNKIIESGESSDSSAINVGLSNKKVTEYKNEYERAILERDDDNNDYKIIEISGKT